MKKSLLVMLGLFLVYTGFPQRRIHVPEALRNKAVRTENQNSVNADNISVANMKSETKDPETEIIGETYYDLQTNTSCQNRIYLYNDGKIGTTFTFGMSPTAFADRGTGYNFYNGSNWGPVPVARIETDRTGWSSYCPWGTNGEINVAHYSGASVTGLAIYERASKGSGAWTSYIYHSPEPLADLMWPRIATGGFNHNTLHLIALTLPVANGGVIYQGQDGALLYSRSSNGGATWDIQNVILPGMGSSFYTCFQGDTYEIAAEGNNVAILFGDDWTDMALLKSTDNGNTWTKTIIWDHPYPMWNPGSLFPTDTFYCADGSHSLAFDNSGKVHIAFGINRAYCDGTGTYWFPLVDGIGYWNEDMAAFSNNMNALSPYGEIGTELVVNYNLIGWAQDVNQNGTWDILGEVGAYYIGASSMPQLVIDSQNNKFLIYSSVTENYNNGSQDYRHLWGRGFNNSSQIWGSFTDLTSDLIYIFSECVFPSCSPTSDDDIHLVFQEDYEPGLAVRGDLDPYTDNSMYYMKVPKSDFISLTGDGTLLGTVTESGTGSPIFGATISISGTGLSTTSNSNGNYSIPVIPEGTYSVSCSKSGYYTETASVVIYENQNTIHNFQMEEILVPGDQDIGLTRYDLQSNSSMQNRIYFYPDGFIGATFTFGINETAFADRGTGYNRYDGTSWGPFPTQRIEPDRTGWPSYFPLGINGEGVISHFSGGTSSGLAFSQRTNKGTGSWTTSIYPVPTGVTGLLWPRAVSGGTNFNTIHLITLTMPVANGGIVYQGQDGALLYSRSTDEGQTWEISNTILPGLGSDYYNSISSDVYEFAEPVGNTIAMLVGGDWMDLVLMKSTDNGNSWTKTVVWQHPYPFWITGSVTDTFYCVDGAHSIALDNSGKVHIAFGINRAYSDAAGTYWFPLVDGIGYWNEDMPTFSDDMNALSPYGDPGSELIEDYNLIGWTQDINNNGTWDILGEVGLYYLGTSSMPQLVIDEMNQIFLFYSSITETYNQGAQDYRHIWARASANNGQTWGDFVDLNSDLMYIFSECVFPSCAPITDNYLHLIFQEDIEPGMAVRGDMDPYTDNYIQYIGIDKSSLLPAYQNGTLEGYVTETVSGNPIPGALIQFISIPFSTMSNVAGFYEIDDVPPGTYNIQCSKPGYEMQTATVNITEGNTTYFNFQLQYLNLTPPENLSASMSNNDVFLQWDAPQSGSGQWIQWDAGVNNGNGVGLTAGGTFFVASHWYPADLVSYDGLTISKISFFPNGDPVATYNLYIWTGANATNQVISQPTGTIYVDQWNEVTLTSPVIIDASMEYWFGYSVTHSGGSYPAGCDDGPAVSGKGDMISLDGNTWEPMGSTYGLDYNWNLAAFVESSGKGTQPVPMVKPVIAPFLTGLVSAKVSGLIGKKPAKFIPNEQKDLLGYNIYRNLEVIGYTPLTEYVDQNLSPGFYEFFVTAVYNEGESSATNSVWIEIPEPCYPPQNVIAVVTGQNMVQVSWEPPLAGIIIGYNIYRDGTLLGFTTELFFSEELTTGTYEYCVTAVCIDGESEMACANPISYLAPPTNFMAEVIEWTFISMQWDAPENKNLLGYNLYCAHNDTIYDSVNFFYDNYGWYEAYELGLFSFYVTAVYDEGESGPSNVDNVIVTAIAEISKPAVKIYPNPVRQKLIIKADYIIQTISLLDLTGQLITNRHVNEKCVSFDVSENNKGIYMLQVEFGDAIVNRRIIIE